MSKKNNKKTTEPAIDYNSHFLENSRAPEIIGPIEFVDEGKKPEAVQVPVSKGKQTSKNKK